jgi:hypothetical protein
MPLTDVAVVVRTAPVSYRSTDVALVSAACFGGAFLMVGALLPVGQQHCVPTCSVVTLLRFTMHLLASVCAVCLDV